MNPIAQTDETQVPPEEIKRRVELYCDEAFKRQAMPHAIYQDPFIVCPWPNCGYRIGGVDFQLEKGKDPVFYQQAVFAWWKGEGLAGRCPGCGKYVLFTVTGKLCLDDRDLAGKFVLPDNWHEQAYIMN
jgi:hypothetical protein